MIQVEDRERIRRAYFEEHKSIREIAKEGHHARATVRVRWTPLSRHEKGLS